MKGTLNPSLLFLENMFRLKSVRFKPVRLFSKTYYGVIKENIKTVPKNEYKKVNRKVNGIFH